MKPISFYKVILDKNRCSYNYDHTKPFNIKCYAEDDSDKNIHKLVKELNESIDTYLSLMRAEISSNEVYSSLLDRAVSNNVLLDSKEFLDINKPVKLRFILTGYGREVDYDISLDDLIEKLTEYKDKYSIFSGLDISHDYDSRNGSHESFLRGYYKESPELIPYRAIILEKYSALIVELEKEMSKIKKKKEDEKYKEYLKLKKEFEDDK